jgi:hypothetical protein
VNFCSSYGFAIGEIIEALNALGRHDANKRAMIKRGIVAIYVGIIRDHDPNITDDYERLEALRGVWLMTFLKKGVLECKKIDDCLECRHSISPSKKNICIDCSTSQNLNEPK